MSDNELGKLRDEIDRIDREIIRLLNERAGQAQEVGRIKKARGSEFYVPSREREVIKKVTGANDGPFPDVALKVIFREIMSASLSLEEPLKVAFLGPGATFTHTACIQYFGSSTNLRSQKSIGDVFDEVEKGKANYGVVPVENSNEGMVTHTLDRFVDFSSYICGEIFLPVSHCLINSTGSFGDIKKIYSHPQAIAQCRKWLTANAPSIPVIEVASTALAAEMAREDVTIAAIASENAATAYDLAIVESKIEDIINNVTRFLVIGDKISEKTGYDKTSVMVSVKDEPGVLYKMLESFASFGVNLTKIESRPLKKKAWEYVFFLDMEGHVEDEDIKKAVSSLKERCQVMKVLGSYPRMRMP